MKPVETYDAVVIGSGQGGGPLAGAFAKSGRRTALIERAHVGGSCVNEGCTPTKTMVASARIAHLARRAGDYGVQTDDITVEMETVRERKRNIVREFRTGAEEGIARTAGLDLLWGSARFTGPKTLLIASDDGERQIEAKVIVIDGGTRPAMPPLPGLERVPALDSTSIMELASIPDHLLVLGGGYIGLEFAQMFRRFGSEVTIVQRGERLLGREDGDVADAVAEILREEGITVLLEAEAKSVASGADTTIRLVIQTPEGERQLSGSHLLVATGRAPNTGELGLEKAGVHTDERGFIPVNERLQTNIDDIFAIGDVTGGPAFTHISYDDFRILRTNLIEGGSATTEGRLVPYTLFIDPQLGRVGMTEAEARQQGREIRIARLPMTSAARAREVAETRGFLKAVIDAESDQILGFAALAIEGGELMSVVQMAMMGGLSASVLRDAVFAHPTLAESLNNLFTHVEG